MNHTVLAVGKLGEVYWRQACEEYVKRLGRFGRCTVAELPEQRLSKRPSAAEIAQAMESEGRTMLERLQKLHRRAFSALLIGTQGEPWF